MRGYFLKSLSRFLLNSNKNLNTFLFEFNKIIPLRQVATVSLLILLYIHVFI